MRTLADGHRTGGIGPGVFRGSAEDLGIDVGRCQVQRRRGAVGGLGLALALHVLGVDLGGQRQGQGQAEGGLAQEQGLAQGRKSGRCMHVQMTRS